NFQFAVAPSQGLQILAGHLISSRRVFLFEWLYSRPSRCSTFWNPLETKSEQVPVIVEAIEAYLSRGGVFLREPEKLMDLREKAFGTLVDDRITLNPYETFYLVEKKRIKVLDEKTKQSKSLQQLVTKLSVGKPAIWTKYLVYRDLRDRGYLVRDEKRATISKPSVREPSEGLLPLCSRGESLH